jgi:phosphoglucosamine mutase
MLEPALTAGFISAGADVVLLGPIPTPAVAFMTRSLRADLGVVISASHNPFHDNGIKFFDARGFKISVQDELEISRIFFEHPKMASNEHMGKAKRLDDATGRYVEFVKSSFPRNLSLSGLKVVVDTANGAAYKIAPQVLWELGADIVRIGNAPDGLNINRNCGATHTELLQQTVVEHHADIGIALDGDADRLIVVDECGEIVDGDFLITAIATNWAHTGKLRGNNVVATTMSNFAMEMHLGSRGLTLLRSDVGDKYVIQKMLETGANVGGEKSGHIILSDYATTGDGCIAALQVLAYLTETKSRASNMRKLYIPYPQVMRNVPWYLDLTAPTISDVISKIQNDILKDDGRIIIRKSGTEPLTRVMLEAKSKDKLQQAMKIFETVVEF